ncbi:hypothetical protein ROLI_025450 [Roseobacter fucihabitans]|uniref:ATPase AAA-type core domain-containing protein n=1 Tax=Roseobacter fucihabitans TaxID=1537242 RepID=A0ABZ2BWC4_9RHOB|nr:ATP-binding protein [Roseobacter litoralis]MBC6967628.1 replication factor C large subunit [Roseobacter litoralis]
MLKHAIQPTTFNDLVFENPNAQQKLQQYANGTLQGSIILHGPYGTGKSTAAAIVAEQTRKHTNGMIDFPINTFSGDDFPSNALNRIENGWTGAGTNFRYAVIDEFDQLDNKTMSKIRKIMDKHYGVYGLILTTNELYKIHNAIQSRCDVIEMPALSPNTLLPMCRKVLQQGGVTWTDKQILTAINTQSDIRAVLRQMDAAIAQVTSANQQNAVPTSRQNVGQIAQKTRK